MINSKYLWRLQKSLRRKTKRWLNGLFEEIEQGTPRTEAPETVRDKDNGRRWARRFEASTHHSSIL